MVRSGSTSTSSRFVIESSEVDESREPRVPWPWPVVVVVAAAVAILVQWLAFAGIIVPEWLASDGRSFPNILATASSLWLSGHGVPIDIIGVHIGLIPLGLTCVSVLLGEEACRYGARVLWHRHHKKPSGRRVGEVVALHTTVEVVAAIIMAAGAATSHWVIAVVGALLIGLGSGFVGACRGAHISPFSRLPRWARGLPSAVGSTVAVCVAGGSAALAVALLIHGDRVIQLHHQMGATGWGGFCLILVQLAWLPTMALWGTAWMMGPGFAFGTGTFVSPLGTHLGIVPALPVLGALPSNGPLNPAACAWFAVPVIAAIIGGVLIMKSLPEAGFEIGAGLGALSGLISGVVVGVLGLLSRGSLGDGRLSEVGTIMPATAGCAVGILTLVTMLCGFAIGLTRRLRSEESRQVRAERRQERQKKRAIKAEEKARNRAAKKQQDKRQQSVEKKPDAGQESEPIQDEASSDTANSTDDEALGHDIYDSIQSAQDAPDDEDTIRRP